MQIPISNSGKDFPVWILKIIHLIAWDHIRVRAGLQRNLGAGRAHPIAPSILFYFFGRVEGWAQGAGEILARLGIC